jgi:tricorn protease-like protein
MRFLLASYLVLLPALAKLQTSSTVLPFIHTETEHLKNIRDCAISPDKTELYFTHQKPDFSYSVIYRMTNQNGIWSKPVQANFSGKSLDLEPAFSPDGLRLYFASDRTRPGTQSTDFNIWYLERKTVNDQWSEPIYPEEIFNSEVNEFYPSVTSNGDLYFTSDRKGTKGQDDIFCAPFKNGNYTEVYSLSDSINTAEAEYNAWISPDGSFLLFGAYGRSDGFGSGDMYVSFSENGNWSRAINLGNMVNSPKMDYCPFVDLKTGILFFTSKRQAVISYDKKSLKEQEQFPGGRSRLFSILLSEIPLFKDMRSRN